MISSLPLALGLTALFAVTGGYALLRWSSAVAAALSPGRRLAELAHLLMSAAMLVMTWIWYGSAGLWVQIVLFGGFAVWFAADAVRRHHRRVHGCAGGSAHALMAAAMVWMLAAMPLIMAAPVTASGGGGHEGHGGHSGGAGAASTAHAGPAGWAVTVTVLLCVVLLVTAGFWAARALASGTRGHEFDEDVPGVPLRGRGDDDPTGAAAAATTAVAERAAVGPVGRLGARTDAGCHALMSIGMVVMLAAMVAGW
ncbi:DUF5134 domain-containing protein [Pseudonocardia nantongensis]|uniref:DUF5134 domain-containing protein n=1 Tax=Pseudonocardia nantongensis TaxID=1181885 RepID=UPI00397A681D